MKPPKVEYKIIRKSDVVPTLPIEAFNALGKRGWTVAIESAAQYIFQRPKQQRSC